MHIFASNPRSTQQTVFHKYPTLIRELPGQNREKSSILPLKNTSGNQTVQRLPQNNSEEHEAGSATIASTRTMHDFSRVPLHSRAHAKTQSNTTVMIPADTYEQQADSVANQIVPISWAQAQPEKEEEGTIPERSETLDKTAMTMARGSGVPLPDSTRSYFERHFDYSFRYVRVHNNAQAATSARALNAKAYTSGPNIVFGAGQYVPNTSRGQYLLAHELAHVVQQNSGARPPGNNLSLAPVNSFAERQASTAAAAFSRGIPATVSRGCSACQIQRTPLGLNEDTIHQPIIEDYRRRRGLPLNGRDSFGHQVGPSDAEIKYQLSIPNQLARFAIMTPWQLSQQQQSSFTPNCPNPPAWALSRFADYARASRLAQSVYTQYSITHDIDARPRVLGRSPTAAELTILNRNLSRILNLQHVRTSLGSTGGRGVPGSTGSPSLQGRVRITQNATQFGIKRYQVEMLAVGLRGQSSSQLDAAVRQLWQIYNITPSSTVIITDQERRMAILVQMILAGGAPALYCPGDDTIYIQHTINLQAAAGSDIARHETVHFLGGRDQTRQAFVRRYGFSSYLPYWSTFEEGTAELLARESRPPGQQAPASTSTTTTSGRTSVTVTAGPGYDREVRIMRAIMNNSQVGRQLLMQAYFTGNVPSIIFRLLGQAVHGP